jgi:hypothetical protein
MAGMWELEPVGEEVAASAPPLSAVHSHNTGRYLAQFRPGYVDDREKVPEGTAGESGRFALWTAIQILGVVEWHLRVVEAGGESWRVVASSSVAEV